MFIGRQISEQNKAKDSDALTNTSVEGFPREVAAVHHDS